MNAEWIAEHTGMRWLQTFPFGTHIPILIQCILRDPGPILELGMGEFSTPLLHLFSRTHTVVSLDHHPHLFETCRNKYENDRHRLFLVPESYDDPIVESLKWGTVLVDHTAFPYRAREIARVAPLSQYIVVHDTVNEDIGREFRYRRDFQWHWLTTVVSDFRPLDDLEEMY